MSASPATRLPDRPGRKMTAGRTLARCNMVVALAIRALPFLAPALFALAGVAAAQEVASGDRVMLRGLDKVSGETTDITLGIGERGALGRLDITHVGCRFPVEDGASDAWAFLEIHDRLRGEQLFRGWMVASSPALNALDDPRYDVWVLGCQ